MSFFDTQNPGIGGLKELTEAETLTIQQLGGLSYSNGDILYYNSGSFRRLAIGSNTYVLTVSGGLPVWAAGGGGGGSGTVTGISIASANGFTGSSDANPATPTLTIATSITGILKGNGTAISAATAGTDYVTASSTNTFTNKTFDTAGTGNSFSINGEAASTNTGTGAIARATSPTFVTPVLGAATATTINGLTISTTTGTLTLVNGSSLVTAGAFSVTLTSTGATNVTLPTTGTLVNTAVTTLSSLVSIGTVTTGTWNATAIAGQYGGTGVNNSGKTITIGGNFVTSGAFATTLTVTATTNVTLPTTGTLATLAGAEVITNKNLTSATNTFATVTTTTSSATPTPTGDSRQNELYLTAQAANATIAAPTGTPANGNILLIRITPTGTYTLALNAIYRAIGVTIPTGMTNAKTIYLGARYNSTDSVWDVISAAVQA